MPRYKVTLEYEGTRYDGWQVQKERRTIQGALLKAAWNVFGSQEVEFYGAGRTDAGVHAVMQVAHLDVATTLAPEMMRRKLNDELPSDINLLAIEPADPNFHARHDAIARSYVYQIARRRSAFGKPFVWWVRDSLSLNAMQQVAALLTSFHDFRSFTDDSPGQKSTLVELQRLEVFEEEDLLLVYIRGSHFLWKMVRRIVGVMVEAGRGKLSPAQVEEWLHTHSREPARLTAPPSGLFLERIWYPGEAIQDDPLLLLRLPQTPYYFNPPASKSDR